MPQMPMPASGGAGEMGDMPDPAGRPVPGIAKDPNAGRLGGEIMLSRQESKALAALHFGAKDEKTATERARRESGLTYQQVQRLKARADHARSKGMTLKGERLILKPTGAAETDEPGLLSDDVTGKDAEDLDREDKELKKAKEQEKAAKGQPYNTMRRSYAGRMVVAADHKVVGKASAGKAAK